MGRVWLSNVGKIVDLEGDTLGDGPMELQVKLPPESVYDIGMDPPPHFTVAGQRCLLYPDQKYKSADPDAEDLPVYVQVSATVESGVSVWMITDCDYVAGYDRESAIAWYVLETGVEADEIDFEADAEDLDAYVRSDDGSEPRSFRQSIRETIAETAQIPYIAASTEA